jgi:hypothetical protein
LTQPGNRPIVGSPGGYAAADPNLSCPAVTLALDRKALEANRHGHLCSSQRRLVRQEMRGWLVSAMFTAGFGLPVASALPSPLLQVVGWMAAAGTAIYMASKGYDCARDSIVGRIAAITDRFASILSKPVPPTVCEFS